MKQLTIVFAVVVFCSLSVSQVQATEKDKEPEAQAQKDSDKSEESTGLLAQAERFGPWIISLIAVAWTAWSNGRVKRLEAEFGVAADARKATFDHELKIYRELWAKAFEASTVVTGGYDITPKPDAERKLLIRKTIMDFGEAISVQAPFYVSAVHTKAKKYYKLLTQYRAEFDKGKVAYEAYIADHSDELLTALNTIMRSIRERIKKITTIAEID